MYNWEDRVVELVPEAEKDEAVLSTVWENAKKTYAKDEDDMEELSYLLFHVSDAELVELAKQ